MYVMEALINVGLFYIKDPHISVAELAVQCYHFLWTLGLLSRLAMLPLLVDSRTPFTPFNAFVGLRVGRENARRCVIAEVFGSLQEAGSAT